MTSGENSNGPAATPDAVDAWIEVLSGELSRPGHAPDSRKLVGRLMYETGLRRREAAARLEAYRKAHAYPFDRVPFHVPSSAGAICFLFGMLFFLGGAIADASDIWLIGTVLLVVSGLVLILGLLTDIRELAPAMTFSRVRTTSGAKVAAVLILFTLMFGYVAATERYTELPSWPLAGIALIVIIGAFATVFRVIKNEPESCLLPIASGPQRLLVVALSLSALLALFAIIDLRDNLRDASSLLRSALMFIVLMQPRGVPLNHKHEGRTFLHRAIEARDTARVVRLLAMQPDLTIRDGARRTPLALARELQSGEIERLLVAAGAVA